MNKNIKIHEAIVLAGGMGTRLRAVIGEFPKPLAPVHQKPFLSFVFEQLVHQGITRVVLAVGYKWQLIKDQFGEDYKGVSIEYSVEDAPLGTGGALKLASTKIQGEQCFVLNGDSFFDIDFKSLEELHFAKKSSCTIALKSLDNFDRYGAVICDENRRIIKFKEKEPTQKGVINGGIYILQKGCLSEFNDSEPFSFETDYLGKQVKKQAFYGKTFNNYFMDIGIPQAYQQFESDLTDKKIKLFSMALNELGIDKTWTLFLDRDGVINDRLIDDYVKQLHELKIINGVPQAVRFFAEIFNRIVVVTNQQGIGRGLMTADDLEIIHGFISTMIENDGGRIDRYYFAPQLKKENSNYRKPGTGMGLQAKIDYPEIDFKKSLMIGDSETDIEFGMKLGMKTIMLKKGSNISTKADYIFEDLYHVSKALKK